jgi:hypothetical protein
MSLLAALKATQVQAPAAQPQQAAPMPQAFPPPAQFQQQAIAQPMPQQFPAQFQAPAPFSQPAMDPNAAAIAAQRLQAQAAYSGLAEAEVSQRRPRLKVGTHVLKIVQCRDGNFPEEIGGNFFFASDFVVVESNSMAAGSEAGWLTSKGKHPAYFKSDVKAFLLAATGGVVALSDASALEAASEANPLADRLIIAEVWAKNKCDPKTGEPYVNVKFAPVPEASQAKRFA